MAKFTNQDTYLTNYEDTGIGLFNPNANSSISNLFTDFLPQTQPAQQAPQSAQSTSPIDDLTQQILGKGTTNWSGEGYGSAQANAADMAKILAGIGITDVNQFGLISKPVTVQAKPDGKGGYVDANTGTPIDPSTITTQTINGEGGETSVLVGQGTTQVYGNKVTGQEVPNTYSERQTGNAFGGTFQGSGNTGYHVNFDSNGNPQFYTTGASSSDAASAMPFIQMALMATGAGGLLGNALLGSGASAAASGALGGALLGGGTAALTGSDVLKGALMGGAGGALSGYMSPDVSQISGGEPIYPVEAATNAGATVPSNTPTSGYYNEITGDFVPDVNGPLQEPLTNATSGANIGSMSGYDYNPATGDWTMPTGEVVNTAINHNPVTSGGDILSNAGALSESSNPFSNLSSSQIANLLKAGIGLFGAAGASKLVGGSESSTTPSVGSLPTQGIPLNSQDYFNAIQQNYNKLLPSVPKDVAAPLSNWYNSQYGA